MPDETFKPINFNDPQQEENKPESSEDEQVDPKLAEETSVDSTEEPHLKPENKLPPVPELEASEENPEQRKIAGEAPHVTAARPDAFTKEVVGGVVKEGSQERNGVITGDRKEEENPSTTSTPVLP